MSCTAAYAYRSLSGPWELRAAKYGVVLPTSATHFFEEFHRAFPVTELGPWCCRGILMDERTQTLRFYHCYGCASRLYQAEAEGRRARRTPHWQGWNIDHAHGVDHFLEIIHGREYPLSDSDQEVLKLDPLLSLVVPQSDESTWDPVSRIAHYAEEETWGPSWDARCLISIVFENQVHDLAFSHDDWFAVLRSPEQVPTLLQLAPPATVDHDAYEAGVVIHCDQRQIRHWGPARFAPARLREVARRWPGWSLVPEPNLQFGHMAFTGRPPNVSDNRHFTALDPTLQNEFIPIPVVHRTLYQMQIHGNEKPSC